MKKPITACIINARTGEISDAITHADATALRLKVRDELTPEHGRNAFHTVEFNLSIFSLKNLLAKLHPDANTAPITLLSFEFRVHEQQKIVNAREAEYTLAVQAKQDVEQRYADNVPMQTLLLDLLSDELVERGNAVNEAKSTLRTLQNRLQVLQQKVA